ncbi:hypothetical protein [Sulfuriflexus mobilis]|uniref:hypothetical protein n=1 Tax=Sulfuriflexus mobilis TaxID=1811807 RepID=UPI00155989BF|nr:hypothetical protein [Sulfuriflexus mobilis]
MRRFQALSNEALQMAEDIPHALAELTRLTDVLAVIQARSGHTAATGIIGQKNL